MFVHSVVGSSEGAQTAAYTRPVELRQVREDRPTKVGFSIFTNDFSRKPGSFIAAKDYASISAAFRPESQSMDNRLGKSVAGPRKPIGLVLPVVQETQASCQETGVSPGTFDQVPLARGT